jgi:hypothetical protein
MDFLINGVAGILRAMSVVLGGWSFPNDLANKIQVILPYLEKANMFLPVTVVFTVLGLWVALELVLIAYYWITRAINLLRGAG